MSEQLEQKKIFLLALPDFEMRSRVETALQLHYSNTTIYHATEGSEAWAKISNVPPHVIILVKELPKIDGLRLIENVMSDRHYFDTAAIFLSPPPEDEFFVEAVITHRIQFLGDEVEQTKFNRAVAKALNHIAKEQSTEFSLKFLAEGEQLLKEGDAAKSVFLVKRGKLEASHHDPQANVLLGQIEPGEFVGEMAFFNGEPRSADVVALTDCELIEIPIDHLDHVLFRKPTWSKALLATLSKRIKKANEKQIRQAHGDDFDPAGAG